MSASPPKEVARDVLALNEQIREKMKTAGLGGVQPHCEQDELLNVASATWIEGDLCVIGNNRQAKRCGTE